MNVTIKDILRWGPCNPPYNRAYLKELFAGRKTINESDVDALPIPQADKDWGLGRMLPWADNFVFPKGVTFLRVENNPDITELVVPNGVTTLVVRNNPALVELRVPEGVITLLVCGNPALTTFKVPKSVTTLWVWGNRV